MANLTTKELESIKDQIDMEQALVFKFKTFSQTISDPSLSQKFEEIACKHQQHYNKLMSQLS